MRDNSMLDKVNFGKFVTSPGYKNTGDGYGLIRDVAIEQSLCWESVDDTINQVALHYVSNFEDVENQLS